MSGPAHVRGQWIAHLDMDAFFASVEQVCHPQLRGKPLIVCGSPRGRSVVSTASYEARRYGVHSGMAVGEARRRCPQAVLVPVDGEKYAAVAATMLGVLEAGCPRVELVSIDEAALDLSGMPDPAGLARTLQARVRAATGCSCSIGLGTNRLLAKLAAGYRKPDGFCILTEKDFPHLFHPLPVATLPGIGEALAAELAGLGLFTVGQLAALPESLLIARFGKQGQVLAALARGHDERPVRTTDEMPEEKSIGHEHTLAEDCADAARLGLLGLELADRVSLRARRGGWTGRRVTVKLRFPDFTTWTRSRTCREPLMLPAGLADIATTLLERNRDGRPIRLLGISLGMLVPDRQPALPSTGDRLFACRAALARRFGSETLIRAGSLEPGARTGSGMPADLNHGDPAFRADGP